MYRSDASPTPTIPQQLATSPDDLNGRLLSCNPDPSALQTTTLSENENDTCFIRRVHLTVNTDWAKN